MLEDQVKKFYPTFHISDFGEDVNHTKIIRISICLFYDKEW